MKKLKLAIAIIIFAVTVLVGGNVFADMDAPSVSPYKAYVSNPNGAIAIEEIYEEVNGKTEVKYIEKSVIPYGTEFTVMYEYYPQKLDELYVTGAGIYDGFFMIPLKDITPVKEEFDIFEEGNQVSKAEVPIECKILNPDGVQMYTGPAHVYKNMNITIPFGTELTYSYDAANTWIYVTYQGQGGWICVLEGNVGNYKEEKIITGKLCKIYDFAGKVIGNIPGNIMVENYYQTDDWSRRVYITYNGITGFVDAWYDVGTYHKLEYEAWSADTEQHIFEYADINSKIIGSIPKGTEFREYYYAGHNMGYMYVTYNGISGWITEWNEEEYRDDYTGTEENNDNTITNTIINENQNEVIFVPNDNPNMNNNNVFVNNTVTDNDNPSVIVPNNNVVNNITNNATTNTNQSTPQNLANQIIILAIGAAIIGAVSSLVTILLINKTGKNNKNENE